MPAPSPQAHRSKLPRAPLLRRALACVAAAQVREEPTFGHLQKRRDPPTFRSPCAEAPADNPRNPGRTYPNRICQLYLCDPPCKKSRFQPHHPLSHSFHLTANSGTPVLEYKPEMVSRKKGGGFNLAPRGVVKGADARHGGRLSAPQAIKFLEALANLAPDDRSFQRFRRHYGGWFVMKLPALPAKAGVPMKLEPLTEDSIRDSQRRLVWMPRNCLRSIWGTLGLESKQRLVAGCLYPLALQTSLYVSFPDPQTFLTSDTPLGEFPPPTALEQAVMFLLRSLDRLYMCRNPRCETPYFVALHRNQRFCSEPCAQVGQRESKHRWWDAKGTRWRKQRAKKAKKRPR